MSNERHGDGRLFYTDQQQTTSLSLPSWKIVLWTISVLAALAGVVLVAVLIRSYAEARIVLVMVINKRQACNCR